MRGVAMGPVRLTWFAYIVLHPDCNMWMATGSKKSVKFRSNSSENYLYTHPLRLCVHILKLSSLVYIYIYILYIYSITGKVEKVF